MAVKMTQNKIHHAKEEETGPDSESSAATSEEEVKKKPLAHCIQENEVGGKFARRIPKAGGQFYPSGRASYHDIQLRKRSRRRPKEFIPIASGSSLSQNESYVEPKWRGRQVPSYP